jgi:hypothetical protein
VRDRARARLELRVGWDRDLDQLRAELGERFRRLIKPALYSALTSESRLNALQ